MSRPVMSPDGKNLYTASQFVGGPIAEFAVNSDGSLFATRGTQRLHRGDR